VLAAEATADVEQREPAQIEVSRLAHRQPFFSGATGAGAMGGHLDRIL